MGHDNRRGEPCRIWLAGIRRQTHRHRQDSQRQPRDSLRLRVFWAPLGVWLTVDSGRFERVSFDNRSGQLQIRLEPKGLFTDRALLRIEQIAPTHSRGTIAPLEALQMEPGAWIIPLGDKSVEVNLGTVARAPPKDSE